MLQAIPQIESEVFDGTAQMS